MTHGWHAAGALKNGKRWAMHGFSRVGADHAAKNMSGETRHLARQGATFEFREVVTVNNTAADPSVERAIQR